MKTLRDFLRANCMDSEFPESLDGDLLFILDDSETTSYCFDEVNNEIGIDEAEEFVLYAPNRIALDIDAEIVKDGFQFITSEVCFNVAKLQFIRELS